MNLFFGSVIFFTVLVLLPRGTLADYTVNPAAIKTNLASYAGFLNGTGESKMFFWFFPSESNNKTIPLIVWLQGDVGTSSLKGLYENSGPFYVKQSKGTHSRKSYWSKNNNVVYLDTAVGTGFSHYNATPPVYPADMNQLVSNLIKSLTFFYREFQFVKNNDLYLAGDGFACNVITRLAKSMDQMRGAFKLKGLIIENGFCDPPKVVAVTNHWFGLRMFDTFKQTKLNQAEKHILDYINKNEYEQAFDKYDIFIKGLLTPYKTLFNNLTGYKSTENLLHDKEYRVLGNFSRYVTGDGIRRTLKVPTKLPYSDGKTVLKNIRGELMKSSLSDLGRLMDKYRVLLYFGQMNPEISPKGAFQTASSIKWCGAKFFGDVYTPWFVNGNMAGYIADVRTGDCEAVFTWALVRNAGKNIAGEKPEEVSDLINRFTSQTI